MLISGASLAWSSPVIAKLGGNDTVLGRPLTPTEASWVVSSSPFATVFTIILCGYLNNHIGRKTCLVLGTSPRFVCYVIFIFSTEVWMLILGRTINGLLDGMMFATLAMYATEMSSKEIRGGLAILIQIFSSLGILVVWSLGPFMTYLTLNYLGLVISVVLTVPISFIPDSPFSLYKHGKIEEAKKLLLILRGSEEEAEEQIKEFSTNIQSTTFKEHLKKKSFIKAFALSMFFGVGFQLTGYNALTYYMQTILESTHVTISSNVMSSTIGFVQLVASMCTALTTDRFGRKPILIGGVLATSVGMTGLGLFFYLKELGFEMTAFLNFLPLISVGICVLFYSAINLGILNFGLSVAWASPVLVKLREEQNPVLGRPITEAEGSWVVAVGAIPAICTLFLSAYLVERVGRKICIIMATVPRVACYVMCLLASEVWMLIFARALNGIADGMIFAVVSMYASEVASKEIRGSLGSMLQVFSSLGIVLGYCIGPFLDYYVFNTVILVLCIVDSIPLFFVPDSPYFLYKIGKTEESRKVLTYLRGSAKKAEEDIKEYQLVEEKPKLSELLRSKTFRKITAIVLFITIFAELTGYNVLAFYLQTILESTGSKVSSDIASVIIGCIQLTGSFCAAAFSDRFGRKPMLLSGLLGTSLGMLGLGTFFWLTASSSDISGFLNVLPLISMMLCIFSFSASVNATLWPLVAELFDGRGRAVGLTIGVVSNFTFIFLITYFFADLASAIGPAYTYWIFSVNCVILALFILVFIPETKGRTFAEIQAMMSGKKIELK